MIYYLASIAFTIGLLLAWSMCRLAARAEISIRGVTLPHVQPIIPTGRKEP